MGLKWWIKDERGSPGFGLRLIRRRIAVLSSMAEQWRPALWSVCTVLECEQRRKWKSLLSVWSELHGPNGIRQCIRHCFYTLVDLKVKRKMGLKRGKKPINNLQQRPPPPFLPLFYFLAAFLRYQFPTLFHVSFFPRSLFLLHLSRPLWRITLSFPPSFTRSFPHQQNAQVGADSHSHFTFCVLYKEKEKKKHTHILLGPIGAWNPTSFPSNWTLWKTNPPTTLCSSSSLLFFFSFLPPLPLSKQPHNKLPNCCPSLTFKGIMHHVQLQSLS